MPSPASNDEESKVTKVYQDKSDYEEGLKKMGKEGWTAVSVKIMRRGRAITGDLPDSYVVFYKKTSDISTSKNGFLDKLKKGLGAS
ncbi:hypothetical protein KC660_01805 [Candidatus Dojkabacteria bacterium]|uniref:Uncharacterized protein n=1 Tax=Candidatus Dojkabacteria bacterium TaxID=2099670 RepID=A0A955RI15_9BACT|nr:hypothetical protein [Candidatus Dojkabacteria bacterium]